MSTRAPTRRPGHQPRWETIRRDYPAIDDGVAGWVQAMIDEPDILWTMIGDVVKVAKATTGARKTGRRPTVSGMSIDAVWDIIRPERYTLDPFPVALAHLLGARSQRTFAARVPCSHVLLHYLLAGERTPSLTLMEAIADAGKIPPTYFVEYRAQRLGQIITQILTEHPHLSITLYKRITEETP